MLRAAARGRGAPCCCLCARYAAWAMRWRVTRCHYYAASAPLRSRCAIARHYAQAARAEYEARQRCWWCYNRWWCYAGVRAILRAAPRQASYIKRVAVILRDGERVTRGAHIYARWYGVRASYASGLARKIARAVTCARILRRYAATLCRVAVFLAMKMRREHVCARYTICAAIVIALLCSRGDIRAGC